MNKVHKTFCRNCLALCGLNVEVDHDKIVSISGDRDHPVTQGYFCIKGLASKDLHNGEDRLLSSRAGRGSAQKEISVETAIDEIAEKIGEIVRRHGPRSVGLYYGTGANFNPLCQSAMKGAMHMLGSPFMFSSMTLDQSAKWVAMGRMGLFAAGQHSIIDADVGMLVGANPLITHTGRPVLPLQNPRRWLQSAKKRGVKLIVVDPRLTETAKFADLHLQLRPGEDVALFAGMIRLVLERGWEDREFCSRFVSQLEELRAAVDDFTLDRVAHRAGVAPHLIEEAARIFANAQRPTATSGVGPNMGPRSNLSEHLIQALNAICGGFRRAGDIVRNPGFLFGRQAFQEKVIPPSRTWESGPKLRTQNLGPMCGEYPTALLPAEIAGRGDDRLRALIVVGGNPVAALVDPEKTLSAFGQLDLLVSLDSRATETTALSDYVIATSQTYERFDYSGMFTDALSIPCANVVAPIIPRPPKVIEDWEFFWGLANRLGRPLELKRPKFGAAHEDIPGPCLTLDPAIQPTTEALVRWFVSAHGEAPAFEEMLSEPHGVFREDLTSTVLPAGEDDGARLQILPADVAAELAQAKIEEPASTYRYRLVTRRLLHTMNSAYRRASKTRSRYPTNPAFMNLLDMQADEIEDGAAITVSSRHGSIVAYASADPSMRRGVIGMAAPWGELREADDTDGLKGAFVGRLSLLDTEVEPINFMPLQSAIPVDVKAGFRASMSNELERLPR